MSEHYASPDDPTADDDATDDWARDDGTADRGILDDRATTDGVTDDLIPDDLTMSDGLDVDDVPDGVNRAALDRMDFLASLLDDGFRIPGTKRSIGLDPLLGVLPVAGDAVIAAVSLFIPLQAALLGVRKRTLLRMVANIAIDFAVGAIPIVGDAFDWFWKANRKNVNLTLRDLDVDRA